LYPRVLILQKSIQSSYTAGELAKYHNMMRAGS
jgi:hypothetical protein